MGLSPAPASIQSGSANTFTVGPQTIQTGADGNKALITKGNSATQSADLIEAQSSAASDLFSVDANGNLLEGGASAGTSGISLLAIKTGTAPTTSPADQFQIYSADFEAGAGDAVMTIRSETGNDLALGNGRVAAPKPAAAAGASVAGKAITIQASAAVASTDTAGAAAGGPVNITAGAAARLTSGNANGGDIVLTPGALIGSGTDGKVIIRNGANAQTFEVYTSYTDASNYEGFQISTAAGTVTLAAITAGTGTDNVNLVLTPAGTGRAEVRNGSTSQVFRVYNTYTDDSNNIRAEIGTDGNGPYIWGRGVGTGGFPVFSVLGSSSLFLGGSSVAQWEIQSTTGHYKPLVNNTYDFGTSGVTVRTGYFGTSVISLTLLGSSAGSLAAPTVAGVAATGTDAAPLAVVVGGGLGTGAGAGGALTLATPTMLASGTTAQTRVARLTISQGAVTTDLATIRLAGETILNAPGGVDGSGTILYSRPTKTVTTAQSPYTVLDTDYLILADATAGDMTINLPTVVGRNGREFIFKKIGSPGNQVTIDASGAETIDGALTLVMSTQYEAKSLVAGAAGWGII